VTEEGFVGPRRGGGVDDHDGGAGLEDAHLEGDGEAAGGVVGAQPPMLTRRAMARSGWLSEKRAR